MTTKCLDYIFALSKFYCHGVSHEKNVLRQNTNFIFIVVSPSLNRRDGIAISRDMGPLRASDAPSQLVLHEAHSVYLS